MSKLILLIDRTGYLVERIEGGIRLRKGDGTIYDLDEHGACDCQDYIRKRQAQGQLCKHGKSLREHGLLKGRYDASACY